MFGQDPPTDLQNDILTIADRNPDMSYSQIAEKCNCSESYVRETLKDYRSPGLF